MRYIGNKENIIGKIHQILKANGVAGKSFFDFFSGTANVARFYKDLGYTVYSSDIMYMSYCLQKAYIENNAEPTFEHLRSAFPQIETTENLFATPLDKVVEYLNKTEDAEGFVYSNYTPEGTQELSQPRMYFSSENGRRIDGIRQKIEEWKNEELVSEYEYYILLSCLIESVSFYANVAGVYAAFQKKWDPRATKRFSLRTITVHPSNKCNVAYCSDSLNLLDKVNTDILYLDPPYNARQYLPNYHVLETIAKYDYPNIKGVTGMRIYNNEKSSFCNAKTALRDLEIIACNAQYKYLVMSYNSEGIMPQDNIVFTLSKYGDVKLEQFQYTRYKSNNNGLSKNKRSVFEQLYILHRK